MKQYLYKIATDQDRSVIGTLIKLPLWLVSLFYALGVRMVTDFYFLGLFKEKRLSQPVISVGNITWGGTGKTPLVISIIQFLKEKNFKPAILTRGYMDSGDGGEDDSDEALLLKRSCNDVPVLVGADRFKQAQEALKKQPIDLFVMDDGFQHLPLARDLDIAVIDTLNPFGNGWLIPRGILREPVGALRRADIFVLTRVDLGLENLKRVQEELHSVNPATPIVESIHQPVALVGLRSEAQRDLNFIKGKTIASLNAIGNPDAFHNTLKALGARIQKDFSFIDHHVYTVDDIKRINRTCLEQKIDTLVTTEKDAVKLRKLIDAFEPELNILSLKIKIKFTAGEKEFFDRISHLLQR